MKKANNYKLTLQVAVGNTTAMVMFLIVGSHRDNMSGILLIAIITLLISAISLWIKGVKQYIDFRFQELEKKQSEC